MLHAPVNFIPNQGRNIIMIPASHRGFVTHLHEFWHCATMIA